jgi:hypothetical protein
VATLLLDLPLEVLAQVCLQLNLLDLLRAAGTCRRLRNGDDGLETVELPTKSPVVTALRELAFSGGTLIPSTRPTGCSETWVAYLAHCAQQRRLREPIAAGNRHSLFLTAAGQLLACGEGGAVGHGDWRRHYEPAPVAAMAGVRVVSVAAGKRHSLALSSDGRVYSWGYNAAGQLGHGDRSHRTVPTLVEGLQGVRGVAVVGGHSLAVTQGGPVFHWGHALHGAECHLQPMTVEGFEGVRVLHVGAYSGHESAYG